MPGEPNKPPNAVDYKVKLKVKEEDGEYKFSMPDWFNPDRKKLKFDKSELGMRRDQIHWVMFRLHNAGDANLRFHPDKDEAFWIKPGDSMASCPTSKCSVPGITAEYSSDDLLVIRNDNAHPEDYRFTLNLLEQGDAGGDPSTYVAFDPGWSNRNSGFTSTLRISKAQAIGIAAVSVAAIASIALLLGGDRKGHRPKRKHRRPY